MTALDLSPLYRSSIGYDRLASLIDSAFHSDSVSSNFPPYDIEVIEENKYVITLAIAGFAEDELEISVENGVLRVRGEKKSEPDGHRFLYQGISSNSFERKFDLAEYVEVTGAQFHNGLLKIGLVREIPEEMKPKRIDINGSKSKKNLKLA